jgi:uncharacterized protein (TIGR00255 family)
MIVSMTGFGKSEFFFDNKKYTFEVRSINSRFCEVSFRVPKYLSSKENELKEIVRKKISRGKINVSLNIEGKNGDIPNLKLNKDVIKDYMSLLKALRKSIGTKEKIKLEHLLSFSEILKVDSENGVTEDEYNFIAGLLNTALDDLNLMKQKEGEYLKIDLIQRINFIDSETDEIFEFGKNRIPLEKEKIYEKLNSILEDKTIIDDKRLELELLILSEKLDITEECIRLKSHLKFFKECADSKDYAGRRINFLLQEMNREVNTIASKASNADISQKVTILKEELEKIKEQIQNIE